MVVMLRPGGTVWIGAPAAKTVAVPDSTGVELPPVRSQTRVSSQWLAGRGVEPTCPNVSEPDTDSCTGSFGRRHLRGVSIDRLLQLSAAFDALQNGLRFITRLRFRATER